MEFNNEMLLDEKDKHSKTNEQEPRGYPVDDKENLTEDDLARKTFMDASSMTNQVREGQPMGGHNFGKNNLTPAGDDKNNPSQNAGYSNAYFARTEPAEEHPENSNFTAPGQEGTPDYSKAQTGAKMENDDPKPERAERGNGENDRPHPQEEYREGTADEDKQTNTPGPEELPDQQKVGEKVSDEDFDKDHIET